NMKWRPTLFWDTNPKNIDVLKHAQYVIERIADFGNDKEARWALDFYDKKTLRRVILKSRSLRPRTKTLWKLILNKK
ncbi:MAG: hypothetical protein UW02_C0033G0001, partial [Candidatus Nomurabacteria bacterium GW2011_GWB1_43_7]